MFGVVFSRVLLMPISFAAWFSFAFSAKSRMRFCEGVSTSMLSSSPKMGRNVEGDAIWCTWVAASLFVSWCWVGSSSVPQLHSSRPNNSWFQWFRQSILGSNSSGSSRLRCTMSTTKSAVSDYLPVSLPSRQSLVLCRAAVQGLSPRLHVSLACLGSSSPRQQCFSATARRGSAVALLGSTLLRATVS